MESTNVQFYPEGKQPPPPYSDVPPPQFNAAQSNTAAGPSVTIIQPGPSVGFVVGTPVGSKPSAVICKSCHAQIVSRVEYKPTMRTHLMALLLCLFVCWPCVCVPYCVESCNSVEHYCPNCNAYIGTYN